MSKASKRISRRQKRSRRGKGLVADRQDVRDFQFSHVSNTLKLMAGVKKIPSKVDLRIKMSPIRNQGSLGSCTAQAVAVGLMESTQIGLQSKLELPLSPLFLYYETRIRARTVNQDSGASLRDTIKTAAKAGVCGEHEWPYKTSKWKETPPDLAYDDVDRLVVEDYYRINNLQELKESLAYGNPVVFGLMLYESFESIDNRGLVPMPNFIKEDFIGGHAMCAVGYDNAKKVIIVRNSWGKSWGDAGYCYIPFDYMSDPKFCVDMWTAVFSIPV